ncbi:hypothetical protein BCR33DRAFT_718945 [Rhizoclosmatium globosum]|uniref:Spindle and kinetochore-associated protein 3 n=1 Tax=Rhizoclosmatium globosum TaxID=329046 RepID=A0A1Y2C2P8_9FUNG|nr:hypothetical protein BCR33DRAFT_718945 [Rhizoclosmatium globosum]|eukprot:ORY41322.1 hypothetical protein BCR33DRAFT_718945 [Rhizoclosmatium globosum]
MDILQANILSLEIIETSIKDVIGTLTRSNNPSDLPVLQSALEKCISLEQQLSDLLLSAETAIKESDEDARRWDLAQQRIGVALQTHLGRFGYRPPSNLNLIPQQPSTPAKHQQDVFSFETPAGAVGGLVGSNDFEDQEESRTPTREVEEEEDDMSHLIQGVGVLEQESLEDPPSPTLESLGISSFSLGILKGVLPSDPSTSPHSTPLANRLTALRFSSTASDVSKSSPTVPEITPTPLHHSIAAHGNSIFGDLIRPVLMNEYAELSGYLSAQISFDDLNDAIVEINEYVTDKRFQGMGEDDAETECLTLEELMQAGAIEPNKVKPVLCMLLEIGLLSTRHGKYYIV